MYPAATPLPQSRNSPPCRRRRYGSRFWCLSAGRPADLVLAADRDGARRDVDRGPVVAGLLAALAAMAGIGLGQVAGDFDLDRAAEASACVNFVVHVLSSIGGPV